MAKLANADAFSVPAEVVARVLRHLALCADALRRVDPDAFLSSIGFHRIELEGYQLVYELDGERVTAYVTSAARRDR
jgi:hypothetical protein